MDIQTLVQALTNTLDPSLREQAEAFLDEVSVMPAVMWGGGREVVESGRPVSSI